MRNFATFIFLAFFCINASAQFSTYGTDPWNVKWNHLTTENFHIIYPSASDSVAFDYGRALEKYRPWNSLSSGFLIGQNDSTKMPVVIHNSYTIHNGAVVWAPKRLVLFPTPDAYNPVAMPAVDMLAIHEGRHAAQMQFGKQGFLKVGHWITGEMFAGAMAGLYPGQTLLEGDAVATETALSRSGRGRTSFFLNYMMPAFNSGDMRDYWRWTYGGQTEYAPDYYRAGYLLVSGMRAFYDDPLFTKEYFERVDRRLSFFSLQKTVKAASGMRFKDTFESICSKYSDLWESEAETRAPFIRMSQITQKPRLHTQYEKLIFIDDCGIFSVKEGLDRAPTLVLVQPDGKEKNLRPFASHTSNLFYDPALKRVYWTETLPSHRWSLKTNSAIRYFDTAHPKRFKTLVRKGRFFNCAISTDGSQILSIEYPESGGSRICLFDSGNSLMTESLAAPDSLQITEATFCKDRIFASGISENGFGIYEIIGKSFIRRLGPQPFTLTSLSGQDGSISFECERTGVNEYYVWNPDNDSLTQMTSSRYGVSNVSVAGDSLYYEAIAASDAPETYRQGRMIYSTSVSDLHPKTASFDDIHRYKVADILSAQEKELAERNPSVFGDSTVAFSATKPYSKIRLPHFHSWAPIYFDYNSTQGLSDDYYYQTASIGATALFQNLLGSGYGSVGYSLHSDPYKNKLRNSFHLNYLFTGWIPVIELKADFGDHDKYTIMRSLVTDEDGSTYLRNVGTFSSSPYINVNTTIYVPLNFSSGGWRRGLIPQIKYAINNNNYDEDISLDKVFTDSSGRKVILQTNVLEKGGKKIMQTFTSSLRGYLMQSTASSGIYPHLGIGIEAGYRFFPGHQKAFTSSAYIYTYGYIPGLMSTHGIRISGAWQRQFADKEWCFGRNTIVTYPRGFANNGNLSGFISSYGKNQYRFTFDYAMPVALPFKSSLLSPLFYIKRLEIVPFADVSVINLRSSLPVGSALPIKGNLKFCSFGTDITLKLSNFLWLPFESSAGFRFSYNIWDNPYGIITNLLDSKPFRTDFLFTIDF